MSIKDIAVFMFSTKEDEAALAAGEALARASDADLAAVLLEMQPDPLYTMEGVMVTQMWAGVLAEAQKGFAREKADLEERIRKSERLIAVRELVGYSGLAATDAAVHARHADLSVMVRPGGSKPFEYRNAVFEGVLFGSGRPVMIVPSNWKGDHIGKRIVVAWNGKRESARALADAIPLLEGAEAVYVVTVDAKPSDTGVGPAPGADITAHLARRGLKVELRNLDGLGQGEMEALIAEARAVDADLIVMGGYGRPLAKAHQSDLREAVANFLRRLHHSREGHVWRGIEIDDEPSGCVRQKRSAIPGMKFERGNLCCGFEGGFGAESQVRRLGAGRDDALDGAGRPGRGVALIEFLAIDAVWCAHNRTGPMRDVVEHPICDGAIIIREFSLRDRAAIGVRPKHPSRVGEGRSGRACAGRRDLRIYMKRDAAGGRLDPPQYQLRSRRHPRVEEANGDAATTDLGGDVR